MGVGVFARLQHTPGIGNGTRVLGTGPDLCFNMGPGSETGFRSPGGSYLEMGGVVSSCFCLRDGNRLRRTNDQSRHRRTRLRAQLGLDDLRL
jgi:hypothetical protein